MPAEHPLDADLTSAVVAALDSYWHLPNATVEPHHGGMNSLTWFVTLRHGQRYVAKAVPASGPSFEAALRVAALIDAAGIPAGAPLPASNGGLTVALDGWALALLAFVEGRPLTGGSDDEQRTIGQTLARAHLVLRAVDVQGSARFHWVDPRAPHLELEPWIRPAVGAAIDGIEAAGWHDWTSSLLHSDPAPEAFLVDRHGVVGLIDWDRALVGPALYDVASAAMYLAGLSRARPMLDAYARTSAVAPAELEHGLVPMLRFRAAVQADYFARRIATGDMTGISAGEENAKGLDHARRLFLAVS